VVEVPWDLRAISVQEEMLAREESIHPARKEKEVILVKPDSR
jgi:hypothetical protein